MGLPVRVRWDAFVIPIALYLQALGSFSGPLSSAPHLKFAAGALLYSVLLYLFVYLHEIGHAYAARRLRVPVREIVLTPLGGTAVVGSRMPSPGAELVVTASGPASSATLALAALAAALALGASREIRVFGLGLSVVSILANAFLINAALALFNLIPSFDMDGARMLRAALSYRMHPGRATYSVALLGQFLCVPMAAFGFYLGGTGGALLVFIAVMNFFACERERYAAQEGDIYGDDRDWTASLRDLGIEDSAADRPRKQGLLARFIARRREARRRRREEAEAALRARVDDVLKKVKESGLNSLTRKERNLLMKASEEFRRKSSGRIRKVT
ncbi:MAG: site-2 protease family protein [Planctomycetota bacterium]|nr:site-2 protease family protein [Planctomycetota bacterium]